MRCGRAHVEVWSCTCGGVVVHMWRCGRAHVEVWSFTTFTLDVCERECVCVCLRVFVHVCMYVTLYSCKKFEIYLPCLELKSEVSIYSYVYGYIPRIM